MFKSLPQLMRRHPPTCSTPCATPLWPLHYCNCPLPVGCCVFLLSFGHLRPGIVSLYFLTCVVWCRPNKGISHGAAKPNHWCLAWDHTMPQRHVLGVPLINPWSERAKPLRVGQCQHIFGHLFWTRSCIVFLCVCGNLLLANWLLQMNNIKSKIANFCALIWKIPPNY
jgi:hypothetical protein